MIKGSTILQQQRLLQVTLACASAQRSCNTSGKVLLEQGKGRGGGGEGGRDWETMEEGREEGRKRRQESYQYGTACIPCNCCSASHPTSQLYDAPESLQHMQSPLPELHVCSTWHVRGGFYQQQQHLYISKTHCVRKRRKEERRKKVVW